jgi:MoaA/NifB/PqqE/SkfB family radical SAM enzyme
MPPDVELPRFVQIEPVGQCNLRCRMCPISLRPESAPGQPPAFMDFGMFKSLIDQFGDIDELHLQGLGEPLMHPRFFDMVSHAAQRGIRVSTNTNMTLVTERRAAECVASGLHTLHASLDGAHAASYEAIRLQASFPKVIRNLRRLVAARRAAGSTLPYLKLVAVLMRANLAELPALVRLASEEGVESLSVQQLCHDFSGDSLPQAYRPMRAFIDSESLRQEDRARTEMHFEAARAEAQRLGIALRLPNLTPRRHAPEVPGRQRCDWPWRGAYISYDGQAMPCCMVATPDRMNFGSMASEGVAAVWNGPAYSAFREALSSATPPPVCSGCAIYNGTF